MERDQIPVTEEQPAADELHLDVETVLEEYRHRQMLEHLTGPTVSVIVHIVGIILLFLFWPATVRHELAGVEVEMEEMQIKELDEDLLEELQKLEEMPEEVVPTVEKPDVPRDVAEVDLTEDFESGMVGVDAELDLSDVLDIRPADTKLATAELYEARTESGRKQTLQTFGGSVAGETAVMKGLRWLKKHQNPNGSWDKYDDPKYVAQGYSHGVSGLALLAFLAHGETPMSGEFGPTVQKAMQFLANEMMAVPDTQGKGLVRAYTNGIVTYALAEAYGLTKVPFLKPAMEKGLGFIVRGQQDRGGFDYRYKLVEADGSRNKRWDLSVSGWQIQAMKAGYVAGADVPGLTEALEKSVDFITRVTYAKRDGTGQFGYTTPGQGSWAMQGTGVLCLQLLGEKKARETKEGIDNMYDNMLRADFVVWDAEKCGNVGHGGLAYAWYYVTQAMFHAGGREWRDWNKQFAEEVIKAQKPDGHWETPAAKEGGVAGQPYDSLYTTSLCCLMMQVYYRYLPTYKMPEAVQKAPAYFDVDTEDLQLDLDLD